ncbi:MAG: hypothetical protein LBC21_00190 [Oscillospiraceae bacterium]|jgi:O6-methylguanine-DNA--protein-cysteine methyltransferase|nr:hypothetical protein [Oscillospiraceae bacterium]
MTAAIQRCQTLLQSLDSARLETAIKYLERLREEKEDMDYCVRLWDEAAEINDGETVSAEEVARRYGL